MDIPILLVKGKHEMYRSDGWLKHSLARRFFAVSKTHLRIDFQI